ncbi:thiol oxidase [Cryptococcus deuterogattii 99/473]|uniref:Sulfhydryl oxidase n=2 Tax=Cryptococcus deuterogattii TaxID=1859096 RepID=A0A0D0V3P4_9TREE|nr:thiol oxidase [Cryptococcus deuterogattii LA55]KIR39545.1 thiol oxidase [Cryptococcus deuterogattii Ram5]KIR73880.1 thiol oxidase [Cryptococcus deuterogattii CA1014]KIR93372.1 thiol oxidase [Cryptococcus deuterogattii CBS 10090]KIR99365.1 thiol oxidase [Cryptococcus deuterogattii 2001/935-1]KIY59175.1 thiol oxidase [Cryptococcus deuterogattii 99/473]
MPKLENATAKAELGRAAWRVLHLMTLRYPDEPTEDDRLALKSYFHLFSRLYPCGECAQEFQKLLKEYPPQTSSRKSASLWLCHVHNQVNARLGKPEFDCLTLDETYDCGCGDDSNKSSLVSVESSPSSATSESYDTNGVDVVKAMTDAVHDPTILSHGGAALQGEFEVVASGEGVGLSADEVDEGRVLEKEEEQMISQEQVGGHEWRKSQVVKEEEWEKEKANHGLD